MKCLFLAYNCHICFYQFLNYAQKPEVFKKAMWQFSNICAISNLEIAFTSVSASLDYIEAANSDGYVSYCDQKIEFNKSPILAVFGQIITLLAYF